MTRAVFLLPLAVLLHSSAAIAAGELVAEFSGSEEKTTPSFTTRSPWEIQWDFEGRLFQVSVYSATDRLIGIAVNHMGTGTGASYQPGKGEFYLRVNADGPWRVQVKSVDSVLEPEKTQRGLIEFSGSGGGSTRAFRVSGPWELQWDNRGHLFHVIVYTNAGKRVGVAASQTAAGTGSSIQAEGGEYYLDVNAMSDWKIRIVPSPR